MHIELGNDDVDATTSHPFYVVGRGWVAAGDLAVGDAIQALSGDAGVVTGLRLEKLESPIPVYNLDVEDFHSYFVAGGVLVHNGCREAKSTVENKANNIPERFKGFHPITDHKTPDVITSVDDVVNPPKGSGPTITNSLNTFQDTLYFIWK